MNETTNSENNSVELEKPVQEQLEGDIEFPPFPDPTDDDFEEDITEAERQHYKAKFRDLNRVVTYRLHCSACDRHLGCSPRNESRIRAHPMLRTLMCHSCHTFYNSGEFEKGDDGSELYCRWCGQGGQVYCCSACPHVFCAKCIKRNLGMPMIKEIEDTDDWKCFKCNSKYLWDLRAICWAVLRYCDLKNKITHKTENPILKEAYQKQCAIDLSDCCKHKYRRKEKTEEKKKEKEREKEKQKDDKKVVPVLKTSTIQVKKFASINVEDRNKIEKKPQKRPASPKNKPILIKNPVAFSPKPTLTPVIIPPMAKKVRMPNTTLIGPARFSNKTPNSYARIRPKPSNPQMIFNGFNSNIQFNPFNDNINLSLESLTQGLDMAAVAGMANNIQGMVNNVQDDDVVCTPDFPLEPLCEVTEDNNDDDVQCMGPVVAPKPPPPPPPPLVPRNVNSLPGLCSDNIIQMTENDVTVNAATGGLKFRVDPQTLSANKMYRLPDGRIFAINANPSMPGGYSATIVAVTDDALPKMPPKGATYAAKLSSVGSPMITPPPLKAYRNQDSNSTKSKRGTPKTSKTNKKRDTPTRDCDVNVPVEWYRYNLIDAVDALEYSLSKLNKLKQEATTMYLRTRSINEMRNLHKRLERLLNTSTCRFNEIRDNINKEMKQYLVKRVGGNVNNTSEDDDDVEILHDDNDDPIFIDENSVDSNVNESQDVDLTVLGSSDHNDSSEKSLDKNDGVQIVESTCIAEHQDSDTDNNSILPDIAILPDKNVPSGISILPDKKVPTLPDDSVLSEKPEKSILPDNNITKDKSMLPKILKNSDSLKQNTKENDHNSNQDEHIEDNNTITKANDGDEEASDTTWDNSKPSDVKDQTAVEDKMEENIIKDKITDQSQSNKKNDDSEMSEETIENLLDDDPDNKNIQERNLTPMDISA